MGRYNWRNIRRDRSETSEYNGKTKRRIEIESNNRWLRGIHFEKENRIEKG